MFKRLFIVALCMVLLAGCAAVVEPAIEPTTTQAPDSHATTAMQPDYVNITTQARACWCGEDVCDHAAELLAARAIIAPLNIEDAPSDEFMAQFNNIHTITYEPHPDWADYRRKLVFWTDEPVHDFAYVRIGIHSWDQSWAEIGLPYYASEVQHTIEEFLPGDAFVIQNWFDIYQYPSSGFTFIDQNGEQRYMFFLQSMRDGHFHLTNFENNPPN